MWTCSDIKWLLSSSVYHNHLFILPQRAETLVRRLARRHRQWPRNWPGFEDFPQTSQLARGRWDNKWDIRKQRLTSTLFSDAAGNRSARTGCWSQKQLQVSALFSKQTNKSLSSRVSMISMLCQPQQQNEKKQSIQLITRKVFNWKYIFP